MNLMIDHREPGGVIVLSLNGRIVLGKDSKRFEETVKELAAEGGRKILLNLGEVTSVDSAGLGALIRSYNAVAKREGQLKLLRVPDRIQVLLQITRLHTVFEMFDDEASAVRSLVGISKHAPNQA